MTKITPEKIKEAIKSSYGIQSLIAQRCGVTKGRITQYLNEHPKIRELVESERSKIIDIAQTQLIKLIKEGDFRAINLALTTLGASEGYMQRQANLNVNLRPDSAKSMNELYSELKKIEVLHEEEVP